LIVCILAYIQLPSYLVHQLIAIIQFTYSPISQLIKLVSWFLVNIVSYTLPSISLLYTKY